MTDVQIGTGDYKCSCGRRFANEILLKRHRWVTRHEAFPPSFPSPVSAVANLQLPHACCQNLSKVLEVALWAGAEAGRGCSGFASRKWDGLRSRLREAQNWLRGLGRWRRPMATMTVALVFAMVGLSIGQALGAPAEPTPQPARARARAVAAEAPAPVAAEAPAQKGEENMDEAPAPEQNPATQMTAPAQAALAPRAGDPQKAVEDFYANLDKGELQAAYSQLSRSWQAQLGYQAFAFGYRHTVSMTCKIYAVREMNANTSRVYFGVESVEKQGGHYYLGAYTVVKNDGAWQIDEGWMRQAD